MMSIIQCGHCLTRLVRGVPACWACGAIFYQRSISKIIEVKQC